MEYPRDKKSHQEPIPGAIYDLRNEHSYCGPHRAATYFCLESVGELDLSGSLFGSFEVCFAVLPVPSPLRVAPFSIPAKYTGGQIFLSENFLSARK